MSPKNVERVIPLFYSDTNTTMRDKKLQHAIHARQPAQGKRLFDFDRHERALRIDKRAEAFKGIAGV